MRPGGAGRAVGPWAAQAGEAGKEAKPQRSSPEARAGRVSRSLCEGPSAVLALPPVCAGHSSELPPWGPASGLYLGPSILGSKCPSPAHTPAAHSPQDSDITAPRPMGRAQQRVRM